jgi:sarcosine oxidase, subunit gamma
MSRQGALHGLLGAVDERLRLIERPFAGLIDLRGDAGDAAFRAAVEAALGIAPPIRANTAARKDGQALLWLGPDEWLAVVEDDRREAALAGLRAALAGRHAAVTDVSEGSIVLEIDLPQAADILSRGCPLDFDPGVFPAGSCAQSVFGKTGVVLLRETAQRFVIVVRRSFARYFYLAVQDAARMEFCD